MSMALLAVRCSMSMPDPVQV
ncbi:hypothetical protein [Aeromonas jandaei]